MTSPPTTENGQKTEPEKDAEPDKEESLGTLSTVEPVGPCRHRIKAEVPSEKVTEELDRNYREWASSIQLPGFRRGHVPRRLIEKRYGEGIEGDVKESLIERSFHEVVKEKELKVLGKPRFDNVAFRRGEPLRYEVEVEVRPDFALPDYTGVEVEEEPVEPARPEELDARIAELRQEFGELVAVELTQATPEDYHFGRYTLSRDGLDLYTSDLVVFKPATGLVGEFAIPDLKDLVQKDLLKDKGERGEAATFTVPVEVPPNHSQEALRGSKVDLRFNLEEVKRVQLPPADDELARRFDAASLADLRARIEKQVETRRRRQMEERLELRVVDRIADAVQFDIPEGLLTDQLKLRRLKLELALAREGVSREKIEEALKKVDEKAVNEELRRDFKRFFIVEKIAEEKKLFATEDEVNLQIALLAQNYSRPFKDVQRELEESERLETLRLEIRHAKTLKFLREKAKIISAGKATALAASTGAAESAGVQEAEGAREAEESKAPPPEVPSALIQGEGGLIRGEGEPARAEVEPPAEGA